MTTSFDVAIVGGGPAGLAAALTLGRAGRRTLLLDTGEPRNAPAAHMHNLLGFDGVPPGDLRATARAQLGEYPNVEPREVGVETIEPADGGFAVALGDGSSVDVRRVVLATGIADVPLDIPGFAERWGRSVLHCPYCHGHEVRGKRLAVLGASAHHAFIATLLRRGYSDDVVLLLNGADEVPVPDVLAEQGVAVHAPPVAELRGAIDVVFADGATLERDAVFSGGPGRQRSSLAEDLGCRMLEHGSVEVDEFGRTSVPGVSAVGDMARRPTLPGPMAAVAVASASGLVAAVGIDMELNAEATGLPAPVPPREALVSA